MTKKIVVNDNFTNILNFIKSSTVKLSIYDVLQYSIDYDQYKEFYLNYHIFKDLLIEHNQKLEEDIKNLEENSLL